MNYQTLRGMNDLYQNGPDEGAPADRYDPYADLKYCFKCDESASRPCSCNPKCDVCGLAGDECECEVK